MQPNFFVKTHGLGNDYIVLDKSNISFPFTTEFILKLCDIHYGIGSDGILLKVPSDKADFGLRIFNPDGSEAEKSGNGLRIFAKYLFDYGYADSMTFSIETPGGVVKALVTETKFGKAQQIKVDMGKAEFQATKIPVTIDKDICINHELVIDDQTFIINCVSVGNPHCVILSSDISEATVKKYGPLIETHPMFPNRINVQFAKVISPFEVQIQIWERGAGYTLASGSSSCAVACVCHRLNFIDNEVKIIMPGGTIDIALEEDGSIQMTGPVREISSGIISNELIEDVKR